MPYLPTNVRFGFKRSIHYCLCPQGVSNDEKSFITPSVGRRKRDVYFSKKTFAYDPRQRQAELVQGFNYDFKDWKTRTGETNGDETSAVEKKSHWVPGSVADSPTWNEFKEMLVESLPSEKAAKNLALFMFCKLKKFI